MSANGEESEVQIAAIAVGDILRVRPGEKVPVDGVVTEGRATVDESMVTGESLPVTRETGGKVIGGTLNASSGFLMRAEKIGSETMLSRIVQMVADAQRSRAPIQRLADQVSGWFVPLVIFVAILAFAAWSIWGPEPRYSYGLVAAVAVLIIACPCALGLATPMSIMVGVGRGAQAGVLIRDAEALERLERVDTLVIDKTGTLTQGKPSVTAIATVEGQDEDEAVRPRRFGSNRQASTRSAAAIVAAAKARKLALAKVAGFDSPSGKGVIGMVDRKRIAIGNAGFLKELEHRHRCAGRKSRCHAPGRRDRGLCRHQWQARRRHRHRRRRQGHDASGIEGSARRRRAPGDADRRQPHHRASGRQAPRHRRGRGRRAARQEGRGRRQVCEAKAGSSPWPATASTTRRRSPLPMSVSPWALAPMSRWKAPG